MPAVSCAVRRMRGIPYVNDFPLVAGVCPRNRDGHFLRRARVGLFADRDPPRPRAVSGILVPPRRLLGSGVGVAAAGLHLLLRQATLRPNFAWSGRAGASS